MPKINVYLPQQLADSVRVAELPVSEICQRALSDEVGRLPVRGETTVQPNPAPRRGQSSEERAKDLERGAAAVRYGLAPTPTVPVIMKPIGAATALAALRAEDPSLLQWETKAQDVAGWAAALEVADELNAPWPVRELIEERLAEANTALADVQISNRFGSAAEVLDLVAELQARAHPSSPR